MDSDRKISLVGGRTLYCNHCERNVKYTLVESVHCEEVFNDSYRYQGLDAYCTYCGKRLESRNIENRNKSELYKSYFRNNNIIPNDKIRIISSWLSRNRNYKSPVRDWPPRRLRMLYYGAVPTPEQSDELWKIYKDIENL